MVTEHLDLSDILKTFAREFSLGQRMRADLGMLLLHNPKIIFLDEPILGLDVLAKKKMINFLKKLNKEKGITIVVTSHDMDDLEEMAERIILLSKEQIAFDGNFEELRKIQNNSSRLIITSSSEAPVLDGMELIISEEGKYSYKFDKEKIKINEIL